MKNMIAIQVHECRDQTFCKKILLQEGLLDMHSKIVGDGLVFGVVEGKAHIGLMEAHKAPDGAVLYRFYMVSKRAPADGTAAVFERIMSDRRAELKLPSPVRIEIRENNKNN